MSRHAFDQALDEGEILVSAETIAELKRALGRETFTRYITEEERLEFLAVLLREARFIEVNVHLGVCRDPRENKFPELAISGGAACLVSGDGGKGQEGLPSSTAWSPMASSTGGRKLQIGPSLT